MFLSTEKKESTMAGTVAIFGGTGRFGRAAEAAFDDAGWQIRSFARSWKDNPFSENITRIEGDAFDVDALIDTATNCEIIIHALNPPYPKWGSDLPRFTANVIKAARATGATVMLPGNVYNYGAGMPQCLTENTPHGPTSRKGRLREEMERAFANAAVEGVQTVILRAGDFIEREKTGNWFDSQIAANINKGRVMYPGPLDQVHSWAYLPDLARAMVELAEKRKELTPFEEYGFPGYSLTGDDLVDVMEEVTGRNLTIKNLSWPLIRFLSFFAPMMWEISEMSYLWRIPHMIDGAKLAAALPGFEVTPVKMAIADAVAIE